MAPSVIKFQKPFCHLLKMAAAHVSWHSHMAPSMKKNFNYLMLHTKMAVAHVCGHRFMAPSMINNFQNPLSLTHSTWRPMLDLWRHLWLTTFNHSTYVPYLKWRPMLVARDLRRHLWRKTTTTISPILKWRPMLLLAPSMKKKLSTTLFPILKWRPML